MFKIAPAFGIAIPWNMPGERYPMQPGFSQKVVNNTLHLQELILDKNLSKL